MKKISKEPVEKPAHLKLWLGLSILVLLALAVGKKRFQSDKSEVLTQVGKRGIASVESSINVTASFDKKISVIPKTSLEPSKEKSDELFLEQIKMVRESISADTIGWSATLPEPKTALQKALWLYTQIAREGDVEAINLLHNSSVQFLSADVETANYFVTLINHLKAGSDQKVKNFLFQFSRDAFPDVSIGNWILNDYDQALRNPQKFSLKDQEELERLLVAAPDISWERKKLLK